MENISTRRYIDHVKPKPLVCDGDSNLPLGFIGVYADSLNLCANPPIGTCLEGQPSTVVERCLNGPNAYVMVEDRVYRNKDCLECNEGLASVRMIIS